MIADAERKGAAPRPVLAVVRRQRVGARHLATARSCSASASRSGRRASSSSSASSFSFLLCGVVAIAGKRGLGPDDGALARRLRRARATGAASCISWLLTVGWETVLTILADAGHRDRLRRGSAGAAARRPRSSPLLVVARADRRRRRDRLRPHHADADGDHRRHRRAHRRLHPAHARPHRPRRRHRAARRLRAGVHRRPGLHHDRVRPRLGQHRRRLLALPAARTPPARASSAGRPSARSVAPLVLVVFGLLLAGSDADADGRRSRPTRSARSPRCCRPGSSCRSRSSPCSAWSAARCSTSTPPDSRCSRRPAASRDRWPPGSTASIMTLGTIYVVFIADELPRRRSRASSSRSACRSPPGRGS